MLSATFYFLVGFIATTFFVIRSDFGAVGFREFVDDLDGAAPWALIVAGAGLFLVVAAWPIIGALRIASEFINLCKEEIDV